MREGKILSKAVEQAVAELQRRDKSDSYFNDPVGWARDIAGVTLWSKQREIAESLVNNRNVAVKAGHGVGKSFLASVLICWWVDTRFPNVYVASTAPSGAQISAILWREIRKMKNEISRRYKEGLIDHELPGYITSDNIWKDNEGQWIGFGRKPPEHKEDDAFQGIHEGAVLAIGDEAVGLTEQIIDALGNITSNEGSRRLLIANPTNPASYFGKLFKHPTGAWEFHTISVLDSPNFTDEKNSMPPEALARLTSPDYVDDKKLEYGEDSPRYKARVLGEFAYELGDTLIKTEDVAVAVDTEIIPGGDDPLVLGVDVARFGQDLSVIYSNQAGRLRYVDSKGGETRTTEIATWVHRHAVDLNATEVRVDAHGVGGGVADQLVAIPGRKYTVIEMNSNKATPDPKQWHNTRAYWWDMFRSALRAGQIDIDATTNPDMFEKLHDELTMVEYKFSNQTGGLLIESKDDMKKRKVKSPDFADAAIYATAESEFLHKGPVPTRTKVYSDPETVVGAMPDYLQLVESVW